MRDTKRRKPAFLPGVDALEGRLVLNAAAAPAAAAVTPLPAREQRELKHELKVELRKEKHDLKKELHAVKREQRIVKHSHVIAIASVSKPAGAMNVTVGAGNLDPSLVQNSAGSAVPGGTLQVQSLANNSLDAANAALQGLSDGVATVGTVTATRRTAGTTTSALAGAASRVATAVLAENSEDTFPGSTPTTTNTNTVGIPVFTNLPTTPGTAVVSNPAGANTGAAVVFNNLPTTQGTATVVNPAGIPTGTPVVSTTVPTVGATTTTATTGTTGVTTNGTSLASMPITNLGTTLTGLATGNTGQTVTTAVT